VKDGWTCASCWVDGNFLFFIFSNQIAEKVMGIKQQRMAISKIKLK
jgi:hypothetical protein